MPQTVQQQPAARTTGTAQTGPSQPRTPAFGGLGNAAQQERLLGQPATGSGAGASEAAVSTAPSGIVLSKTDTRAALASEIERVQVWAGEWEMTFSRTWVRQEAGGIVLDWPTAMWGAPPVTKDLSMGGTQPLDARWAVKHARDAAGWPTLDGATQTHVDAVLSGETNGLSSMAQGAMRRAVRDGFAEKTAEEQAKTLSDLVGPNAMRPMNVNEKTAGSRAALTRTGPTEVEGHAFASGPAKALRYVLTWPDGHAVEVFVAATKDASLGYHTIEQVEEAMAYVPEASRKLIKSVQINPGRNPMDEHWAREYGRANFRSYMTAGVAGVVDIYPDSDGHTASQRVMTGCMQHESGHVWSQRTWGTDREKGRWLDWKAAMQADGLAVSGYAGEDIQEDVAETIQAYASTRGTPGHEEYRRMVPARFAILDTDFR